MFIKLETIHKTTYICNKIEFAEYCHVTIKDKIYTMKVTDIKSVEPISYKEALELGYEG